MVSTLAEDELEVVMMEVKGMEGYSPMFPAPCIENTNGANVSSIHEAMIISRGQVATVIKTTNLLRVKKRLGMRRHFPNGSKNKWWEH